ncbi:MAG: LemA family protein [Deltaproteobacteria bacterium]|nr:LemA family protein [Deltaproteobacteria bacterium]
MIGTLIFLAILLAVIIACAGIYNSLVTGKNQFKNAFSQIDVQLKRRYDLIPNLVETAKGYMKHERETLEAVISARSSAFNASSNAAQNPGDPTAMQELAGAEALLSGALGKLLALSENYPDLKADQQMLQVQEELTSTENRISFARQAFNDAVMAFNITREKFPNNIIAGMFNFLPAQLLESTEAPEEKKAPKVSF